MSSSVWHQVSFGDLVADGVLRIGDGYRAKNNELGGDGPIFLRAGQVRDTHIDFDEADHFIGALTPKLQAKMSQAADVVVTTKGNSIGRVTFVTGDMPSFIYSPHLCFWRSLDPDALHPGFLRYWSRSREFRTQLAGFAAQTDMAPFISLRDQLRLKITVPPASIQRMVARTLGALDDKIELNRRMNRTLESIVRAVFKSWFVDFDPVCRKMKGSDLEMPAGIAALFPPRLETSATGAIPSGWRTGICAESFAITMGQSPPGDTYNEAGAGLPFYQGRRDFGERFPARRVYCMAPSRLAHHGDTLVSVRAPVGDVNIATEDCCVGRGVAAVRHTSGAVLFTYEAMHALRSQFEEFEAGGTVFGSIGGKEFRNLPMVVPPTELIRAYETAMGPIGDALDLGYRSSRSLTLLRDSLLPQLMGSDLHPLNCILEVRT